MTDGYVSKRVYIGHTQQFMMHNQQTLFGKPKVSLIV